MLRNIIRFYTNEQAKKMDLWVDAFTGRIREIKIDKSHHYLAREFFKEEKGYTVVKHWRQVGKTTHKEIADFSTKFREVAAKLIECHFSFFELKLTDILEFSGFDELIQMNDAIKNKAHETTINDYHMRALIVFAEVHKKESMFVFLNVLLDELVKNEVREMANGKY